MLLLRSYFSVGQGRFARQMYRLWSRGCRRAKKYAFIDYQGEQSIRANQGEPVVLIIYYTSRCKIHSRVTLQTCPRHRTYPNTSMFMFQHFQCGHRLRSDLRNSSILWRFLQITVNVGKLGDELDDTLCTEEGWRVVNENFSLWFLLFLHIFVIIFFFFLDYILFITVIYFSSIALTFVNMLAYLSRDLDSRW